MHLKETLAALAEEVISQNECQLVSFQLKGNVQQYKLVLLVDTEPGVTIEECAKISRQLNALIEERNLLTDAYTLEVSSPGIEAPLKEEWQYRKNIGRKLKIILLDGVEKEGMLKEVSSTHITVEGTGKPGKIKKEDKLMEITYQNIKESTVQVSFN